MATTRTRGAEKARALLLAAVTQAALLLGTVFAVVVVPILREEPEFVAPAKVQLPQRELDLRAAVAEFEQVASPVGLSATLTSVSALAPALPALPDLPELGARSESFAPGLLDPSALMGSAGFGGALAELAGAATQVSFFGVEDRARRVAILFDVSSSVRTKAQQCGVSLERIREETRRLLSGLNANHQFALIQFTRRYQPLADHWVTATQANRAAAERWLTEEFRTEGYAPKSWRSASPNGIESVLAWAWALEPDVVYLLSDGSFQRDSPGNPYGERVPWPELQRHLERLGEAADRPARLHFIGFKVAGEDRPGAGRLAASTGGKFRLLE